MKNASKKDGHKMEKKRKKWKKNTTPPNPCPTPHPCLGRELRCRGLRPGRQFGGRGLGLGRQLRGRGLGLGRQLRGRLLRLGRELGGLGVATTRIQEVGPTISRISHNVTYSHLYQVCKSGYNLMNLMIASSRTTSFSSSSKKQQRNAFQPTSPPPNPHQPHQPHQPRGLTGQLRGHVVEGGQLPREVVDVPQLRRHVAQALRVEEAMALGRLGLAKK